MHDLKCKLVLNPHHIDTVNAQLPHARTKHCPQCKDIRINGEEKEENNKKEEEKRKEVGLRNTAIMPNLQIDLKVLEILVLESNHPTELIMLLLNKVTECNMLSLNISSEGHLLLLD